MFFHLPILSILIWLPLAGAVLVLMTGGDQRASLARGIAVVVALLSFLLCIPLYLGFDPTSYLMQYREDYLWLTASKIHYALGIDGISLVMIILTNFTGLLVILAGLEAVKQRVAQYLAIFLILQAMIIGVFASMDAILFYVFWEGMLIPMYLIIGMWGSSNRVYASIKFFLYTFFGSILMLVALLYLAQKSGSYSIQSFYHLPLTLTEQILLFFAFLLAFAVKVPMWPVHTWLPDAHTEAPTAGSVILAALLLKLGVYGFLRFSMPILPLACQHLSGFMIVLSLIAIVYIGLIAIVQADMKKLIAYSSISHMGIATLGCFMAYDLIHDSQELQAAYMGLQGAVIQMVAHAFSSGAMFFGVGWLAARYYNHSRLIKSYGGVANTMPVFAAFFMLFALSNVGLPGTAGFVGEFMVIVGAMHSHFWVALVAATTLILGASYTLWMYKRVFFGPVRNDQVASFRDLSAIELINYLLLAAAVLWLGLNPEPIVHVLQATLGHLLAQSLPYGVAMSPNELSYFA
ncbi:MAG TPA: NADH-quinone oxidoreductase subunit M [Gammaproteobacteria bacterium]|nr:NADH-quinone oxidoreductase subunit M [Gammaproteobacteria bacterium]